jgi:hypothetical protein
MAAVLTTSMSLRIVLSIRGTLVHGGSFALTGSTVPSNSSRATHIISARSGVPTNSTHTPHTYTLDDMRSKPEAVWGDADSKATAPGDDKGALPIPGRTSPQNLGVKVTIDREVGYDSYAK